MSKRISELTPAVTVTGNEKIPFELNDANGYVLASQIGKDSYTKTESDNRYLSKTGGTVTGLLSVPNYLAIGRRIENVLSCSIVTTTYETVIKTKIPFEPSRFNLVHIKGFAYGFGYAIEMTFTWYHHPTGNLDPDGIEFYRPDEPTANLRFYNPSMISQSPWKPNCYFFAYQDSTDNKWYVAISLVGEVYFLLFQTDYTNLVGDPAPVSYEGWSIEYRDNANAPAITGKTAKSAIEYKRIATDIEGNARTAIRADQDAVGRDITDTYATKDMVNAKQAKLNGTGFVKANGETITYDNSTYATTTQLNAKQDALSTAQLAAVNSGIKDDWIEDVETILGEIESIINGLPSGEITYLSDSDFYSSSNIHVEYGKTYHITLNQMYSIGFDMPYWSGSGNNPNNGKEMVVRVLVNSSSIPSFGFYNSSMCWSNLTVLDTSNHIPGMIYEFNIVAFQNYNLITSTNFYFPQEEDA